jgi:hypothetical protein
MTDRELASVLRELMTTAQQFETKAAKHTKLEPERFALREAITRAQLLLSILERQEHAERAKRIQQQGYAMLLPPKDVKNIKEQTIQPKRRKAPHKTRR